MVPQTAKSSPPEPKSPLISPSVKGPLFMYLTIVVAFAIVAIFVVVYVLKLTAPHR
jgi:hypothetical protein